MSSPTLSDRRRAVQQLLQASPALYAGEIDGRIGARTIAAFDRLASAPDTAADLAQRQAVQRLLVDPPASFTGAVAGHFGPLTREAFLRLANAPEPAPSSYVSIERLVGLKNARALIVAVAREFLGLRETSPNHAPHLKEFWAATSYPDGENDRAPWCSAFVTFCVREADRRSDAINLPVPPTFPAVAQWVPWARQNRCQLFTAADVRKGGARPMAGDIMVMLPRLSHITIVEEDYVIGTDHVVTIEGNTNSAGSREGDGVFDQKHRTWDWCGTFIRIPAV